MEIGNVTVAARPGSILLPLSLALLLLVPATLQAQGEGIVNSNPTGFMLGAHVNGSALSMDDVDDVESGGGIGLALGYGFNRTVTVYFALDGASMDSELQEDAYFLGHGDLGARIHFGSEERKALFYLEGAMSAWVAQSDFLGTDVDVTGSGGTVGVGLEYFFRPGLALDLGLKVTSGTFDEVQFMGQTEEVELGATSTRFNVGLTFYPSGG